MIQIIIGALGGETLKLEEVLQEFSQYRPRIRSYVGETLSLLQKAVAKKENVLFEGAHGFFLDNDWGTYPFCTASAIVPRSINSTCGWLDVELLCFSCQVCGATEIALTKLDILAELKKIKPV